MLSSLKLSIHKYTSNSNMINAINMIIDQITYSPKGTSSTHRINLNLYKITIILILFFSVLILSQSQTSHYNYHQTHFANNSIPTNQPFSSLTWNLDPHSHHIDADLMIKLAIEAYSLKIPDHVNSITYDPELFDRGLIIQDYFNKNADIFIGDAALESWSLLASTLAHEAEVHGNQSFLSIGIMNLLLLDGVAIAERSAYNYELSQKDRFGLSEKELIEIEATKNLYYPASKTPGFFDGVLMSLAKPRLQ